MLTLFSIMQSKKMSVLVSFIISTAIPDVYGIPRSRNNVCKTFSDYATISSNENCYYNPDMHATPEELAARYGLWFKNYTTVTADGYIITAFRLINRRLKDNSKLTPVILQHGLLVDGLYWMISGEGSLAFVLANAGFDVWVPNFRGTQYSNRHVNWKKSDKDYWNWSFYELGKYDHPAMIELVHESTNSEYNEIVYVGHSMGAATALIYESLWPDHATRYLGGQLLLAPAVYLGHLQGSTVLIAPFADHIINIAEANGIYAVSQLPDLENYVKLQCSRYPFIVKCQDIYSSATGLVVEQIRPEIFPIITSHFLAGTPLKTLNYFMQLYLSGGRFQYYDYGPSRNMKLYNSTIPPEYEVEKVSIPTYIFYGSEDNFVPREDAEYLFNKLNYAKGVYGYKLAHNDFAFGKQVDRLYQDIINVIRNRIVGGK